MLAVWERRSQSSVIWRLRRVVSGAWCVLAAATHPFLPPYPPSARQGPTDGLGLGGDEGEEDGDGGLRPGRPPRALPASRHDQRRRQLGCQARPQRLLRPSFLSFWGTEKRREENGEAEEEL